MNVKFLMVTVDIFGRSRMWMSGVNSENLKNAAYNVE